MGLEILKEAFIGAYDGVSPASLLPIGGIADGLNMRKVAKTGGWKVRKGDELAHTTTLESSADINSLHQYTNPRSDDYHFLAQVASKLYDSASAARPPSASPPAGFGSTVATSGVGTTPGFSTMVGEWFFYADGTAAPLMWGGNTPYPIGFFSYDDSATTYNDYTRHVTDKRTATEAICLGDTDDTIFVMSSCIVDGFYLTLGSTVNVTSSRTMTVESWQSGSWNDLSATDNTKGVGTATMSVSGTVTWSRDGSDEMKLVEGVMGYVYRISFSAALSNSVDVVSCTVTCDMEPLTNKWDGNYNWVSGCRFYDQSIDTYQEALGKVTNDSSSLYLDISEATTSDFLYIKTPEPATGFGIGVVVGYENTGAGANISKVEYWDGDSWNALTSLLVDGTLDGTDAISFSHTGAFSFDGGPIVPQKTTLEGDKVPGFWYRLSWDAALSTDVRIYSLLYIPFPESMAPADGVVEFKDRLFVWGDPEFPNRLRFSAQNRPDCFSGFDSGYTDAFGDMSPVTNAIPFYNELMVFKENSVFLLEGFSPPTFGIQKISDTVGLASPQTAKVVEVGFPSVHRSEPRTIAIWQDVDGIYVLDGAKPRKVSLPVNQFFNQEYATSIAAASIKNRASFIDPLNNEYHLLLPAGELVYNYVLDEWYPPWERNIDLLCGLTVKGTDDRYYVYGGDADGFVKKLESDTSDKNTSNADVAISHSLKTRAISSESPMTFQSEAKPPTEFSLRHLWAELKARSAGSITTKHFKNQATSGTTLSTPAAMSMIKAGFNITFPKLDLSLEAAINFQIEFSLSEIDQEMEIYGLLYEFEVTRPIGM